MKILSCVPKQEYTLEKKLEWIDQKAEANNPDIFVTPQEYIGGAYIMRNKKAFIEKEIAPSLSKLCIKHKMGLIIGLVEKFDDENYFREAIWFFDRDGALKGKIYKFALPAYDHILTNGYGNIEPEINLENRFQIFNICKINVSAIFCWEAFSNVLWTGLSLLQPDIIFSMIKFGVSAWPSNKKINDRMEIDHFGYAGWNHDRDVWIDRLYFANVFQVKCPIINSTNSWNLRPSSKPLCGMISAIDSQGDDSLWYPKKNDKLDNIPEKIIIDEINIDKIRMGTENRFLYKDIIGNFPPFSIGKYTMMFKMKRIEERLMNNREKNRLNVKKKKNPGTRLF